MPPAPKISIAIPTRNRTRTLRYTLETCLNQINPPTYEIVINDNGDDNTTADYIATLLSSNGNAAEKVKYRRRDSVCAMTENFEDLVRQTTGDYIVVLGDDDGILPMALFEIGRLIERTNAKAIRWSNGLYTWPDAEYENTANYLGASVSCSLKSISGRDALKGAIASLEYVGLPLLYINSAVHKDVVAAIRSRRGAVFGSRSPDVFSGVAVASCCDEILQTTAPFTLAGLSGASNGLSAGFNGPNPAPRADFVKLNEAAGIYPHPHVPDLPIYPVVAFAESFLYAKEDLFPADTDLDLSRKDVLKACAERSDVNSDAVRLQLISACCGDSELLAYVEELLMRETPPLPSVRLRPALLGFDGANVHLDTTEFNITNIKEAADLLHKLVWPLDVPLEYRGVDTQQLFLDRAETLNQRTEELDECTADLVAVRELLVERTEALKQRTEELDERTADLVVNRPGNLGGVRVLVTPP